MCLDMFAQLNECLLFRWEFTKTTLPTKEVTILESHRPVHLQFLKHCLSINVSQSRNQEITQSAEAYFPVQRSHVCIRFTILLPLTHWSITSLSLPCPSYRSSGHSGTHDPCVWEEVGEIRKHKRTGCY